MIQWKNSSRSQRHARDRRGQSLILIFFTLIALIGVLALTLDYGFILLARRQMQTGVNAAALEGVRFRDQYPPLETMVALLDDPAACPDLTDVDQVVDCLRAESGCAASDVQCLRNYIGKKAARHSLRLTFDDDFDFSSNETTIGAGIDRSLVQGDGFQMMTIGAGDGLTNTLANRSSFVYRPDPQLNEDDEPNGDFVRGDYDETVPPYEHPNYDRDEFTPNAQGDAFLARLRRTHNPDGLDQVPGVSSSGGGLPLLIGNLAWFGATDPNARFSIRRDGVIARATAIAQEQVAVRVWVTTELTLYSALGFGISVSSLQSGDVSATRDLAAPLTTVGQPAVLLGAGSPTQSGYVAVVDTSPGSDRVVGFLLHVIPNDTRIHNASPRLHDGVWDVLQSLSQAERDRIQTAQSLVRDQLLKIPSLVRSVR